jgi:hypothetical protein
VYIGKNLPPSKKVSSGMAIAKITSLAKIACLEKCSAYIDCHAAKNSYEKMLLI